MGFGFSLTIVIDYLLIMGRRNALEKDFGLGRINVLVNPSGPSSQPFIKCHQTVHIFHQPGPILHIVPSEVTKQNTLKKIITYKSIQKAKQSITHYNLL